MNTQRVEGHTPTPWKYDAAKHHIISDTKFLVARMEGKLFGPANAAFIVHACNNIERLEKVNEALVEALGRIAHFGNDATSPLFGGDAMRMREIARDALAKEPA